MLPSEFIHQSSILLVDDLVENLQLLSDLLTQFGYSVRSTTSGRMALKALQVKQPDLILLDIKMPEMDGYQVCAAIKADKNLSDIPIIFISALDDAFDKVEAFTAGGVDYITKPFHIEEVVARIENQLTIGRQKIALQQEIKKRQEADQAKTEFLANISHEIRTPINSILGFIELLLDDQTCTAKQKSYLTTAYRSSQHLLNLINNLLDVSKLENGKLVLEQRPFNLVKLLDDILNLVKINARDKGLTLSIEISPALQRNFKGDPFRLSQILINLIANAIKFTEQGFVKIQVTAIQIPEQICFCIADSGIGISADQLDTIFEPFQQADTQTSRRFGGTGLGTTIAKQLVQLMGGKIGAESQQGEGSQFYFIIPLTLTSIEEDIWLTQQRSDTQHTKSFVGQRKFKILLAEDIEENIILAQTRLAEQQHTVTVAKNGLEAVAFFQKENFDLILMDINMPKMDGLQATQQIRLLEKNRAKQTTIIAMTASIMSEERKKYTAIGIDETVGKPIDFNELFTVMESLVPAGIGEPIKNNPSLRSTPTHTGELNLKGIDLSAALQRWRKMSAYQRGLTLFLNQYSDIRAQLSPLLEKQQFETIKTFNHKLQGSSGNLGMTEVFNLSKAIDLAFYNQQTQDLHQKVFDLIAAIEKLLPEIEMLLK